MARTKPPTADHALITEVEKRGGTVTPTQLERWRQKGWLPRTREWCSLGMIRPEIVQRATHLAAASRSGRSIGWLGWVFWAVDDTPETATRLRAALLKTLGRPLVQAGVQQVLVGDSDDAFESRNEAAARMLTNRRSPRRDFDGILRSHAAAAGVELPRSPAHPAPNIFHRALVEPGAQMMVGGAADIGFEGLMEAWEHAWPDHAETIERVRAAHRDAALSGIDLLAESPFAKGLPGLLRAIEEADDRLLCAAVRLCEPARRRLGRWRCCCSRPFMRRESSRIS
ncbi:hypothetical protein HRW14_31735 [Streptomyces lunaelactis]|uniref:hypothetical protein n=1 Tax=Streptomyces lunaelactis TaxID=1535768 RepID=UPI0015853260|nr:hypothetical protein [Streptomyces lunaelactis]NUK54752.1 hypothetical protein [Streptomyces lunaelactis]NUK68459.1 hypothetical protein [Streptomyces lunaelactis]